MPRIFVVIFILGTLLGSTRVAALDPMSSGHHAMFGMACEGTHCTTTSEHDVPIGDCIDHCVRAALDAVVTGTPIVISVLVLALVAAAISRPFARIFSPRGAPAYIASLARLRSLSTVIMRN